VIITDEELARRFHVVYEQLAPGFHYTTRPESAQPWDKVPEQNRRLMEATVRAVVRPELDALTAVAEVLQASIGRDQRAIIEVARSWAGEYGFGNPVYCTEVLALCDRADSALDVLAPKEVPS
jgi:hypothetical protein